MPCRSPSLTRRVCKVSAIVPAPADVVPRRNHCRSNRSAPPIPTPIGKASIGSQPTAPSNLTQGWPVLESPPVPRGNLSEPDRRREIDALRLRSGVVAQLVRASDCRSEGCGFEPRPPRFKALPAIICGQGFLLVNVSLGRATAVESEE